MTIYLMYHNIKMLRISNKILDMAHQYELNIINYQKQRIRLSQKTLSFNFLANKQKWRITALTFYSKFKRYVTLNIFPRKNNCFAVITKKLYEIPQKIKQAIDIISKLKTKVKTLLNKKQPKSMRNQFLNSVAKLKQKTLRLESKAIKQKQRTLTFYLNARFF